MGEHLPCKQGVMGSNPIISIRVVGSLSKETHQLHGRGLTEKYSFVAIAVRFSMIDREMKLHGGVAQLGEHLPCKQGVMGSNPIISTSRETDERVKRDEIHRRNLHGLIAQVVRARA